MALLDELHIISIFVNGFIADFRNAHDIEYESLKTRVIEIADLRQLMQQGRRIVERCTKLLLATIDLVAEFIW